MAKTLSPTLEAAVAQANAPRAVVGVAIAAIVLLPEGVAAVRAARANRLQTSLNLALGSALATIGLTIPVVTVASFALDLPFSLGSRRQRHRPAGADSLHRGAVACARAHHRPARSGAYRHLRSLSAHDDRALGSGLQRPTFKRPLLITNEPSIDRIDELSGQSPLPVLNPARPGASYRSHAP